MTSPVPHVWVEYHSLHTLLLKLTLETNDLRETANKISLLMPSFLRVKARSDEQERLSEDKKEWFWKEQQWGGILFTIVTHWHTFLHSCEIQNAFILSLDNVKDLFSLRMLWDIILMGSLMYKRSQIKATHVWNFNS